MLRLPIVKARTGLSRSTVYLRISEGTIPRPLSLGGRAVGWPDYEIDAINHARIQGKSDDEIRVLVATMIRAREVSSNGLMEGNDA